MNPLEKFLFFIVVIMFTGVMVQAYLLVQRLMQKSFNTLIPRYEIASQKIKKEIANREDEEWVYVDKEGYIILNWRKLTQSELAKLHYIPKAEVYNFKEYIERTTNQPILAN